MSSDIAISVRNVSKHYLMYERPEDRLKQMVVPRLQRLMGRTPKIYFQDFVALNDISFDVPRGETVGIIGRNGCGKSTLLQIVCGTLMPSAGEVKVDGRVAALLELGAGFNPEFTGRENVYLNAAILGLSRAETDARFDDIIQFADIGLFVDQPVKTYSSGMYVRLAFAVAINVDPDILVVDEALAVGDEAFQRKCFARIEEIKKRGGTILFVSHGAQTIVQLCDRAILIDRGEKILEGIPKTVVNQYQRFVNLSGAVAEPVREEIKAMDGWAAPQVELGKAMNDTVSRSDSDIRSPDAAASAAKTEADNSWFDPNLTSQSRVEYESKGATISNAYIKTWDGRQVNVLTSGTRYICGYRVSFQTEAQNVRFGMMVKTVDGIQLGGAATPVSSEDLTFVEANSDYDVEIEFTCLLATGTFFLNLGVLGDAESGSGFSHRILDALAFRVMPVEDPVATGLVDFAVVPNYRLLTTGDVRTGSEKI